MREDFAIRLRDLTMELPTYGRVKRPSWNGLGATQAGVGGRLNFSDGRATVTALDDVSVEIARRERVGLIGLNGAGKSTMLRVMAGIYYPTRGTAESRGRVSTLFSESLGLKPEATGIENIMLSGVSLGLTHGRVKQMIPEIVEFTELGEYVHMPMRTYSTGMRARLAFAVATSIRPEILLIDEIIGAGDMRFQAKVKERLDDFMQSANTLVVASQSEQVIREFCDRAILLERGRVRMSGGVEEVLAEHLGKHGRRRRSGPAVTHQHSTDEGGAGLVRDRVSQLQDRVEELERQVEFDRMALARLRKSLDSRAGEVRVLRHRLQATRSSASFLAGSALVQAAKQPHTLWKLPFQLLRLYRSRSRPTAGTGDGSDPNDRYKDLPPELALDPSEFVSHPPLPIPEAAVDGPVVAAILDTFTEYSLRYEADLLLVSRNDWRAEMEKARPALLLVESAFQGNNRRVAAT